MAGVVLVKETRDDDAMLMRLTIVVGQDSDPVQTLAFPEILNRTGSESCPTKPFVGRVKAEKAIPFLSL
jgi:hypothetical protein